MAGPFVNELLNQEKYPLDSLGSNVNLMFFFHWQMAQLFADQNLNFEQKRSSQFCLTDSVKSQPLAIPSNGIEVQFHSVMVKSH